MRGERAGQQPVNEAVGNVRILCKIKHLPFIASINEISDDPNSKWLGY
jgi:hypothetical protein